MCKLNKWSMIINDINVNKKLIRLVINVHTNFFIYFIFFYFYKFSIILSVFFSFFYYYFSFYYFFSNFYYSDWLYSCWSTIYFLLIINSIIRTTHVNFLMTLLTKICWCLLRRNQQNNAHYPTHLKQNKMFFISY